MARRKQSKEFGEVRLESRGPDAEGSVKEVKPGIYEAYWKLEFRVNELEKRIEQLEKRTGVK